MDSSPVTEIKLGTSSSAVVEAVKWTADSQLSILVGSALHTYDTSSGARPVFSQSIQTGPSIVDFEPYPSDIVSAPPSTPYMGHIQKRIFVVGENQRISDMPSHRFSPVSLSKYTGQIINAYGTDIHFHTTSSGPVAMKSTEMTPDQDVSAIMMRRASCKRQFKYSMNIDANIRLLLQEAEVAKGESEKQIKTRNELYHTWRWIRWIESLTVDSVRPTHGSLQTQAPFQSLADAGVLRLLEADSGEQDIQGFSETLSIATYDSKGRR